MEFKCICGKEFKTKRSMWAHQAHCIVYKQHLKSITKYKSIYKISDELYRCECGKEFNNHQSLNAHFRHCLIHKKFTNQELVIKNPPKGVMQGWDKFTDNDIAKIKQKAGSTLSNLISSGKITPSFKGKKHAESSKEKIRKSTIKYIESLNGKCRPRYSKKCCEFINNLNKEKNWNLQHAENEGEFSICGYFVDGYDSKLNIVFEYDEPYHYIDKINNTLCDKDIERQNYIIKQLKCEFWRYNEYLDLLYKVI